MRASRGASRRGPRSKKAADAGRTLVWIDESGFYLVPGALRTYAPCGQTPELRVPLTYDHLSVISAITPDGRLLMQVQERADTGPAVVRFRKHVLRHIPGTVLIVWDGAPIQRCQPIKDLLAAGAAKRIHVERLPGYAPAVHPDAGSWR